MSTSDSVSDLIDAIKQGDEAAAHAIWERYFKQIVSFAHLKLNQQGHRVADEEDVALSVLGSFFNAARNGRFPDLKDHSGLWRLLSQMTRHKAIDYIRRHNRQCRGGGRVRGESIFISSDSNSNGISQIEGQNVTPELSAIVAEECLRLMEQLDNELRQIAMKKLEGHTNKEIAQQLGCAVATVERRLKLIRHRWRREYAKTCHEDR